MRILSFDLEDWFHVLDNPSTDHPGAWDGMESRVAHNTDRILRELSAFRDTKATFFCLGWVAERYPRLVRRVAAAGHEIGTHSYAHQRVDRMSTQQFDADLARSLRVLEDVVGRPIHCYRAPAFSLRPANTAAFDRLLAHGITIDCSLFPLGTRERRSPVQGPAWLQSTVGQLREMPMSCGRLWGLPFVYGGAGYFRMLPYPLVRGQMAHADYSMCYFHPRDFDPTQPTVPGLSRLRRMKARIGLKSSLEKLRRMLAEFEFITVSEAARRIDWSQVPVVRLGATAPVSEPQGDVYPQ